MVPRFELDPRLKNIDNELTEIVFQEFETNIDLVGIHLRDARNMLYGARELEGDRVIARAALLLAAAALESNLVYLSGIAVQIAKKRPDVLKPPQVRYLQGIDETIDDNGRIVQKPIRQSLSERLQVVPNLLARAIGRQYTLPRRRAGFRKLVRTIARRDAIIHPRWDRYVTEIGWWEAAEAIDGVELYLDSISKALHPYLIGYFTTLYTIPGADHHEVAVGHRTMGKKGPKSKLSRMEDVGILEVLTGEWIDAVLAVGLAFGHDCEGDSQGSMFTRAALVLIYAMLDAHLSVVAQWRMRENPDGFDEAEILFLNEFAVGVGHDGEVWLGEDHQSFKKRIKAVPAILSRRVDGHEEAVDLGGNWGRDLLEGQQLRNQVMHSSFGSPLPRVTKQELDRYTKAVFAYFQELRNKLPKSFEYVGVLLEGNKGLMENIAHAADEDRPAGANG
jgi:hypothetical protein